MPTLIYNAGYKLKNENMDEVPNQNQLLPNTKKSMKSLLTPIVKNPKRKINYNPGNQEPVRNEKSTFN